MDTHSRTSRRQFLARLGTVLAGGAAVATLPQLELMGRALAAAPAATGGYRAAVCIFLLGGNDSFNMLVPHVREEHDVYLASRGGVFNASTNAQGLGLARDALVQVTDTAGKPWGLHPACASLKPLFDRGELGFMANVGTLVQPVTKAEYIARSRRLPMALYSHNDQQRLWMRGESELASSTTGWGGRCADRLEFANAGGLATLPPTISLSGNNLFQTGSATTAYGMGSGGPVALRRFTSTTNAAERIRREALEAMLARRYTPIMQDHYAVLGEGTMQISDTLRAALDPANGGDITTAFPANESLASQLRMIARMIKASRGSAINHSRQIYYATLGGFDTHDNQMADSSHARLLARLSDGLSAFRDALTEVGALNDVVTFTMSDFGRTLNSNGNGTDHAWGGVQLMMGGASTAGGPLRGRRVHGAYPLLELDGPQAVERGRMIPTTSTNQFGATVARWLGVPDADLPTVFPGLGNFDRPVLDFLG